MLYRDAGGATVQLLPNPYRTENYFNGGVVYEIPSGSVKFDLTVSPPFGDENITVYAGSAPLGEISTATRGGIFAVKSQDAGVRTRGVKLSGKTESAKGPAAEFFEDKVIVKTGK